MLFLSCLGPLLTEYFVYFRPYTSIETRPSVAHVVPKYIYMASTSLRYWLNSSDSLSALFDLFMETVLCLKSAMNICSVC